MESWMRQTNTERPPRNQGRCAGSHCAQQRGEASVGPVARNRRIQLCADCTERVARSLTALPGIYEECGRILDGSRTRRWEERTGGQALRGMPLNTAAVEARSAIMQVLASWSGLTAEQRRVAPPRREVRALAGFLLRQLDWLSGHEAVADLTQELAALMRAAAHMVDTPPERSTPVGTCPMTGCGGTLAARAAPDCGQVSEVVCTSGDGHRWALHEWVTLSQTRCPAGDEQQPAAPRSQLWLSATAIARLWETPRGTVYRLASEKGWRRRSQAGRTLYHMEDAQRSLGGRRRRLGQ